LPSDFDPSIQRIIGLFYAMILSLDTRSPEEVASDLCFLNAGKTWVQLRRAAGELPIETRELWRGLWVEPFDNGDGSLPVINYDLRQTCLTFFDNVEKMLAEEEKSCHVAQLDEWANYISYFLRRLQEICAPQEELEYLRTSAHRIESIRSLTPSPANRAETHEFLDELSYWLTTIESRFLVMVHEQPSDEHSAVSCEEMVYILESSSITLEFDGHNTPVLSISLPNSPPDSPLISSVGAEPLSEFSVTSVTHASKVAFEPRFLSSSCSRNSSNQSPEGCHYGDDVAALKIRNQHDAYIYQEPKDSVTALLQEHAALPSPPSPALHIDVPPVIPQPKAVVLCCDGDTAERGFNACREPGVVWPKFTSFTLDPNLDRNRSPCGTRA
jgi:hypothetical protein